MNKIWSLVKEANKGTSGPKMDSVRDDLMRGEYDPYSRGNAFTGDGKGIVRELTRVGDEGGFGAGGLGGNDRESITGLPTISDFSADPANDRGRRPYWGVADDGGDRSPNIDSQDSSQLIGDESPLSRSNIVMRELGQSSDPVGPHNMQGGTAFVKNKFYDSLSKKQRGPRNAY